MVFQKDDQEDDDGNDHRWCGVDKGGENAGIIFNRFSVVVSQKNGVEAEDIATDNKYRRQDDALPA